MKINDISIRGFFVYSETAQYEQGDFVVYGNTIYVCSPKSGSTYVSGELPYKSNNFYTYLGDQSATREDFLSFSENGGGEDKYLSLSTLVDILNTYQKGIDTTGVIGHEYSIIQDEDGTSNVVYKVNNVITETFSEEDSKEILARIFMDKTLNHCIFKVSRHLPEIKGLVYKGNNLSGDCILRQYSYFTEDKSIMRVQELIDIHPSRFYNNSDYDNSFGFVNVYYRASKLEDSTNLENIKNLVFYSTTSHSESLASQSTELFNLYNDRLKAFETSIRELQGNFCFTGILLNSSPSVFSLQNTSEKSSGYINIRSLRDLGPITLNVLTRIDETDGGEDVYKNNTLTVDVLQGSRKYYIDKDLYLVVRLNGEKTDDNENTYIYLHSSLDFSIPVGFGEIINNELLLSFNGQRQILLPNYTKSVSLSDKNITLDITQISGTSPVIFSYYIYDQSTGTTTNTQKKTFIYKPDGSLAPELGKKYFEFSRNDEQLVFYTIDEVLKSSTPLISFILPDFKASLKIENKTQFDIYFPSVGVEQSRFKVSSGDTKLFENSILSGLEENERGIYLYTETSNFPDSPRDIAFTVINNLDNSRLLYTTTRSKDLEIIQQGEHTFWGNYEKPIFSFKEICSKLKRVLNFDLVLRVEDITEESDEQSSSTFNLRATATSDEDTTTPLPSSPTETTPLPPSPPTETTPLPPSPPTEDESSLSTTPIPSQGSTGESTIIVTTLPPENPPILENIGEIKSVEFRLGGISSTKSWFTSAYCRKYFKQ